LPRRRVPSIPILFISEPNLFHIRSDILYL
jgi:hypothetical protein